MNDRAVLSRFAVLVLSIGATLPVACGDATPRDADVKTPSSDAGHPTTSRPEGVALCYSELSTNHPARREFWNVFRAGKLADRAPAIVGLMAAALAHPGEEELALLNGLAHLWRIAEPLPEEVGDQVGFIAAALTAQSELDRAYALCPTDHRIPAWLGPVLVNMGRATGDRAAIDRGLSVLQKGVEAYPSFVLFSKFLVYADRAKIDPDFQMALAAMDANVDACKPADPACHNHELASHNVEGAMVFMGDAYAKAGQRERALDYYRQPTNEPTYRDWDYQALLTERIATLDARVAAFDTDDTADDPVSAWSDTNQCSICHRQ